MNQYIAYFTDPILRAPTIGCMLICAVAAIVGALAVLKRQSLIGETLAHTCYPGVMIALLAERLLLSEHSEISSLVAILIGALASCFIGIFCFERLTHRAVSTDASLCLILAISFGIGITTVSMTQNWYPTLYKQMQNYLFGQAATMTDIHLFAYAFLACIVLVLFILFFRQIHVVLFDPQFAHSIGINIWFIDSLIIGMIVLSIVVGIRSVGVVLMSAMLIFPSVAARAWTNTFIYLLIISGCFGLFSGFFGILFSHELSTYFYVRYGKALSFPTGPMIVIVASMLFLFSFLFAPKMGLVFRAIRRLNFVFRCREENLLKNCWKYCVEKKKEIISREELRLLYHGSSFFWIILERLERKGWIQFLHRGAHKGMYELTPSGMLWARNVVRLHRLWEVYLVEYCGIAKERVHPSAEEMEHIITPEIEKELTLLLHNPEQDPHLQPIPHTNTSG